MQLTKLSALQELEIDSVDPFGAQHMMVSEKFWAAL
jgi:hypothetical protein